MNEKKIELKDQIKGAIAMPAKHLAELIKKKL